MTTLICFRCYREGDHAQYGPIAVVNGESVCAWKHMSELIAEQDEKARMREHLAAVAFRGEWLRRNPAAQDDTGLRSLPIRPCPVCGERVTTSDPLKPPHINPANGDIVHFDHVESYLAGQDTSPCRQGS